MPGQPVCLRYGPFVKMEDVVTNAAGEVVKVLVRTIPQPAEKVKGVIHWVSKNNSLPAIVNQYANLLTVENVGEQSKKDKRPWESYFNENSLVVYDNARVWNLQAKAKEFDRF